MSSTTPSAPAVAQRDAFTRNVRIVMTRNGIKISALAKAMGREYAYVWSRVTGRTVPDLADLANIADALNVDTAVLVSLDEPTSAYYPGSAS